MKLDRDASGHASVAGGERVLIGLHSNIASTSASGTRCSATTSSKTWHRGDGIEPLLGRASLDACRPRCVLPKAARQPTTGDPHASCQTTEAARKVRQKRFVLDGEAVVLGVDGVSDFNALHCREPSRCRPLEHVVFDRNRDSQ